MPKCPKCKKKIDYLKECQGGTNVYFMQVKMDRHGNLEPNYLESEFYDDSRGIDYDCPECGETLFSNDLDAALKFLAGK